MKRYIKLFVLDIKARKGISVLFLFQLISIMFLLGYSIHVLHLTKQSLDNVNVLSNKNSYIISDKTSDVEMNRIMNDETANAKLAEFFNKLEESNIDYYTEYGYDMGINENGIMESQKSVSQKFFDVYNINVYKGRLFEEAEYQESTNTVPVIIGYDLKNTYKLDGIYEFANGGLGTTFKGKIVGILNRNAEYYRLNNITVPNTLNNAYIIPIIKRYKDETMSFSDYDMALTHLVVFSRNETELGKIRDYIDDMNLFTNEFKDVDSQMQEIDDAAKANLIALASVALIVLAFTLLCIWITFRKIMQQSMREYAIHLMCGAAVIDLMYRFVFFVYGMILFSVVIVSLVLSNYLVTLYLVLIGCLLGFITLLYPFIKMKKLNIVDIMRM